MSKEAWKDTGDCRECRRAPYCKSECRAARMAGQRRAQEIVNSYMRASKSLPKMTSVESMKNELRTTEQSIIGECSDETVDSVYEKCRDLAAHSTFSVFSIVSTLCAECRSKKESIAVGIESMDEKLRIIRARGL